MPEPDLASSSEPANQVIQLTLADAAAASWAEAQQAWEQERQQLLAELAQVRSLEHNRLQRIGLLEQALDEALESLSELKLQAQDQHRLEEQLATTEEFSHVQQQAILHLKQQLAQQQQALEARIDETQTCNQTFQDLLAATEAIAQTQQTELERLRSQLSQDRSEVQVYQKCLEKQLTDLRASLQEQQQRVLDMEGQVLAARTFSATLEVQLSESQQQIDSLYATLHQRQELIAQLESQLDQADQVLKDQQVLVHQLHQSQTQAAQQHTTIATLEQELVTAQVKIEELETQVAKQVMVQAKLQHMCRELEAERDRHQTRVVALEQQAAEMQEQILKQARQANEYEAAVQHWKDRCSENQRQAWNLLSQADETPEAVSSVASEPEAELEAEVLETPEPTTSNTHVSYPLGRNLKVDLPAFLARRRL